VKLLEPITSTLIRLTSTHIALRSLFWRNTYRSGNMVDFTFVTQSSGCQSVWTGSP